MPLCVKIKPSSKTVLFILTDAFTDTPARDLQNSNVSFSNVRGTKAG